MSSDSLEVKSQGRKTRKTNYQAELRKKGSLTFRETKRTGAGTGHQLGGISNLCISKILIALILIVKHSRMRRGAKGASLKFR